jgi:hypothetical protein
MNRNSEAGSSQRGTLKGGDWLSVHRVAFPIFDFGVLPMCGALGLIILFRSENEADESLNVAV